MGIDDSGDRGAAGSPGPAQGLPQELQKKGTAAAPGIAIGRAYLVDRRRLHVPRRGLVESQIEPEIERFRRALEASDEQLQRIKEKIAEREESEHYNIIEAHQLILHDEHLVDETIRYIQKDLINAEWALSRTVEHIKGVFDAIEDNYFRERRSDVDFVGERVLRNLMGRKPVSVKPPPDAVVVAHDLSPADTAQMHRGTVAGVVTDAGGKTSHTTIIARAHEIPAVVGLEDVTAMVGGGDLLIVDGTDGVVIIHPSPETVAYYRERSQREAQAGAAARRSRDVPAVTQDGLAVRLMANLDHAEEIKSALAYGAQGIGLFRSEFLFMVGDRLPDEQTHYEHARAVLEALGGRPATFRTFDLGADKLSSLIPEHHVEANPALGLRSIRLCLSDSVRPLFKEQLRGLLRASVHGALRIMFPMISGVQELREVRALLDEARAEVRAAGHPVSDDLQVGIMIEMPSAAVVADHLAREVDFFSIGTNDLIQYTLAVDRVNEHVAYLYEPLHPALLRLVHGVVKAADAAQISCSLCGEMAGDPDVAVVLLGMGVEELSMNAVAIPEVKRALRKHDASALRRLVEPALDLPTAREVREHLRAGLGYRLGE